MAIAASLPSREANTEAPGGPVLLRRPLRCESCGYEIASYRAMPPCPMCHEVCWEPAPWRPFTASQDLRRRAAR
jgi:hypothetical protein